MEPVMADLLARITALETRLAAQDAAMPRITPSPAPEAHPTHDTDNGAAVSRRDWLLKGAAGLAATATVMTGSRAEAAVRTTVLAGTGANVNYGLAAASNGANGDADPTVLLPALPGRFFGAIGTITGAAENPGTNAGVWGAAFTSEGVLGTSVNGNGVRGRSVAATGVRGEILPTSSVSTIAIYGLNNSSYTGGGPGAGGFGVYGISQNGHGLVGATGTAGGAAVVGATNGVAGAWAAAFYGPVVVGGDLIVVGGAKSAAVPYPDGSHRQLYCLESPESWFEDFGTGELVAGCADITIDPGFCAVADTERYHVFLTAYREGLVLHVAKRTPKGFTVEADAGLAALKGRTPADLTGTFSWRVVAKRKDIAGPRLAVVNVPPEPTLPPITTAAPAAPAAPGEEDRIR